MVGIVCQHHCYPTLYIVGKQGFDYLNTPYVFPEIITHNILSTMILDYLYIRKQGIETFNIFEILRV